MSPDASEGALNEATINARAFAVAVNQRNKKYWDYQSYLFARMVERYPKRLLAAIKNAEKIARIRGFKLVPNLEYLLSKRVSLQERQGWAGGYAKRERYIQARQYFQGLYVTWRERPDEYKNIQEFSDDASKWINAYWDVNVKSSTIRQWMKQEKIRRPRMPRKGS